MNGNNDFLSGYSGKNGNGKNGNGKIQVKNARVPSMKFEEKSGFVKPNANGSKKAASSSGNGGNPKTLVWLIGGALVVAAIVVTILLVLGAGGAELKNFEDWEISDVQLWANENNVKLQIDEEYSDSFEEGRVVSQSLPEGTKIKKGDFFELIVSKGHDLSITLPLPDLSSMTKDEVEAWALENFMTKVRITTEYSDDVLLGFVIRYEINDDTVVGEVRRDTPIYVIVSKGKEDETAKEITVPDFKTMAISECFVFAADNGLELTIEERYDDYVPKGAIISQSVKPDDKVSKGDEIIIVLSKGKMITVPDFSGVSKERAQAMAAELGIQVSIEERYSSSSEGRFLSQSIAAGSVLVDGDFLELCYSLGNKIALSSYVGQPREAIETWANDLNQFSARITIKATYTQSSAPAGTIIHQDIANKVVARGTTIKITVSSGNIVFVPDFVAAEGQPYEDVITREQALEMCEAVGLVPIFTESASTNRLPGEVWYQSVAAGTEVYEGSTITLKFTPSAQTQVPDLDGLTEQEVKDAGYNKKLLITFVYSEETVAGYDEQVFEQSVVAGTTVAMGSEITLTISAEAPVPTPTP